MIKVATIPEAWELAYKLADAGEYKLDKDSEELAGYPIFMAENSCYSRICDLGCRLEIMKADGTSVITSANKDRKAPGGGRSWTRAADDAAICA